MTERPIYPAKILRSVGDQCVIVIDLPEPDPDDDQAYQDEVVALVERLREIGVIVRVPQRDGAL